jgi:hypothetical protein
MAGLDNALQLAGPFAGSLHSGDGLCSGALHAQLNVQ